MLLKRSAISIAITTLLFSGIFNPVLLHAVDFSAPEVRLSVDKGIPEKDIPVSISAIVTDNKNVSGVVLRYRTLDSDELFSSLPMSNDSTFQLYTISIPTTDISSSGVEYYVEATDVTGNISQEPFPLHPRVVMSNEKISKTNPKRSRVQVFGTF